MANEFKEVDIISRIKQICQLKRWTIYRLAKESGIPYSSLNNMFIRNTQPTFNTLYKLCRGLNISLADFFSDVDTFVLPISPETREMLELYERLPDSKKGKVRAYIYGLADEELTH